jgi:predicted Zn-dependent peptidase
MVATRGAHGLTYGTHARTDALARSGTLTISSAVDAERTGTAVKAILDELDRLRTTPVDDEELAIARAHAIVDAYEQEGGSRTLHGSLEEVALARRPATEFADLPRRIAAVGPKGIKAAAERWLRVDRAAIVVVGNARVVTPQLREIGLLDPIP